MPIIIEKYILTDNLHNITLTHIKKVAFVKESNK